MFKEHYINKKWKKVQTCNFIMCLFLSGLLLFISFIQFSGNDEEDEGCAIYAPDGEWHISKLV